MLFRKTAAVVAFFALTALLLASCTPFEPVGSEENPGSADSTTAAPPPTTTSSGFRQEDYATVHPNHPRRIYAYTDETGKMPIAEIAEILVNEYLDDMMTRREDKSFEITEYRNLRIDVMDKDTYNNEYLFKDGERRGAGELIEKDNQWYCKIDYEYHYQGYVSAEGDEDFKPTGEWLLAGSYLGYTIQRDGNLYRLGDIGTREFPPV